EMLCWHDLVERDRRRPWLYRMPLLVSALAEALHDRVIPKIFRIDWQFGLMMLYPWAALLALLLAAFGTGFGLVALLGLAFPAGRPGRCAATSRPSRSPHRCYGSITRRRRTR